jgi:cytochrome c peroxidase
MSTYSRSASICGYCCRFSPFRTPTLRGVPQSGPYGHGGMFAQLVDVTKHYGRRGAEVAPGASAGTVEEWVPEFDVLVQAELPTILDLLTAEPAP